MVKSGQSDNEHLADLPDYSEWGEGPELIALNDHIQQSSQYPLGSREFQRHAHLRGQLVCVESGFLQVTTAQGSWLLPPGRAGWMPPQVAHSIKVSGALSGWSLLLRADFCHAMPGSPCVIIISEVLRALADRAASWCRQQALSAEQMRIARVITDEIRLSPHQPLHLPVPRTARLQKMMDCLLRYPDERKTLVEWAEYCAMSPRTLRRKILDETGMNFHRWRQQICLLHALEMLSQGQSVTAVADVLGYASPGNFIAMFRRELGYSPGRFFPLKRGGVKYPTDTA